MQINKLQLLQETGPATLMKLKGPGYTWQSFHHFNKGENFFDFLFGFLHTNLFWKGSTLKGKNLLLGEQILSF